MATSIVEEAHPLASLLSPDGTRLADAEANG
jgi:hypothetical protein